MHLRSTDGNIKKYVNPGPQEHCSSRDTGRQSGKTAKGSKGMFPMGERSAAPQGRRAPKGARNECPHRERAPKPRGTTVERADTSREDCHIIRDDEHRVIGKRLVVLRPKNMCIIRHYRVKCIIVTQK